MTNISGLGNPVKEYKRSGKSFAKVLIVSLICLFISVLLFAGAFGGTKGLDQRIVLSILGLVFLLPPGFGLYMLITRRGSSVTLHENGLIYRQAGKDFATTWDDVIALTESTACRVETEKGECFDLGHNVEDFDEIALKLRDETLKRMLPKAKGLIDGGGSLSFKGLKAEGKIPLGKALPDNLVGGGTFTVDALGIALADDGSKIAWSDVSDFGIRHGEGRRDRFAFFFIEDGAHAFQMNYGALPNAHLLLALCAEKTPHLQKEMSI